MLQIGSNESRISMSIANAGISMTYKRPSASSSMTIGSLIIGSAATTSSL